MQGFPQLCPQPSLVELQQKAFRSRRNASFNRREGLLASSLSLPSRAAGSIYNSPITQPGSVTAQRGDLVSMIDGAFANSTSLALSDNIPILERAARSAWPYARSPWKRQFVKKRTRFTIEASKVALTVTKSGIHSFLGHLMPSVYIFQRQHTLFDPTKLKQIFHIKAMHDSDTLR